MAERRPSSDDGLTAIFAEIGTGDILGRNRRWWWWRRTPVRAGGQAPGRGGAGRGGALGTRSGRERASADWGRE